MFDMMKMMGKVKEIQEKIKAAQDNLKNVKVEAESGAGLVKVVANGNKEILLIDVDPSLLNPSDHDVMKDLIIAAVNKAIIEADLKSKEALKSATEGFIPNIPGFDLNGFT